MLVATTTMRLYMTLRRQYVNVRLGFTASARLKRISHHMFNCCQAADVHKIVKTPYNRRPPVTSLFCYRGIISLVVYVSKSTARDVAQRDGQSPGFIINWESDNSKVVLCLVYHGSLFTSSKLRHSLRPLFRAFSGVQRTRSRLFDNALSNVFLRRFCISTFSLLPFLGRPI